MLEAIGDRLDHCVSEVAYGYDPTSGRAWLFGSHLGRHYPERPTSTTIFGTVDYVRETSPGRWLAVDFKTLNLKHAITMVRGNGKRKLAVFEDPNCGYCKRFEKDLQKVDNVTVHLFLIPILGEDSVNKSRQIWCAADRAKSWNDWMLRDVAPKGKAICNTEALTANLEFANKHRITGTPTLIFEDGSRVPGAIGAVQLEERLARR